MKGFSTKAYLAVGLSFLVASIVMASAFVGVLPDRAARDPRGADRARRAHRGEQHRGDRARGRAARGGDAQVHARAQQGPRLGGRAPRRRRPGRRRRRPREHLEAARRRPLDRPADAGADPHEERALGTARARVQADRHPAPLRDGDALALSRPLHVRLVPRRVLHVPRPHAAPPRRVARRPGARALGARHAGRRPAGDRQEAEHRAREPGVRDAHRRDAGDALRAPGVRARLVRDPTARRCRRKNPRGRRRCARGRCSGTARSTSPTTPGNCAPSAPTARRSWGRTAKRAAC